MIDIKDTLLTNCTVHIVGNKALNQELELSDQEVVLNEELEERLRQFLLKPFVTLQETYHFTHTIDVKMNEVFTCADNLFDDEPFLQNSFHLAKHLYDQIRFPSIKPGNLFICLFEEILFGDIICKGVGIFKSEKKQKFIKLAKKSKSINLILEEGLGQEKLDKGVLILNTKYSEGYTALIYQQNNYEAEYWQNDFLNVEPTLDKYKHTSTFIEICKEYSASHVKPNFGKTEQFAFVDQTLAYFNKNQQFSIKDFEKVMFKDKQELPVFRNFIKDYTAQVGGQVDQSFEVAKEIVQRQRKRLKNEIKLDTQISIKLDSTNLEDIEHYIEKGYDSKRRMNFYKLYYNDEK